MLSITGFIICAAVIFFAGKKLSYYGNKIADITGLGKAWIGLILMASVTSLPELIVGFSSSAIVQSADLAVGDIFGSCAFNLCILAMMDAFVSGKKSLLGNASQNHILSAALGLILVSMAGLGLFLPDDINISSGIGITSFSFMIIYLFSIRLIYKYNKKNLPAEKETNGELISESISNKKVYSMYAVYALVIIASAMFLPFFAEEIADQTGLGKSFVGTMFLAVSTSLPEIAVSIAAIRTASFDLAIGNLLGSNIFNIFILFLDDLFYTKGSILKDASDSNIISAFSVIIMSAVAIIGVSYKLKGKKYFLAIDSLVIFLIYIINIILLYHYS